MRSARATLAPPRMGMTETAGPERMPMTELVQDSI